MMLLLQILSVLVPGFLGLLFALLVVGPAVGGMVHGRRFTIRYEHAIFAAVFLSIAVWLAVAYGWIVL